MSLTLEQIDYIASQQLTSSEILMLKLKLSMNQTAIGKALGYTRQYVSLVITEAQKKIASQNIELKADKKTGIAKKPLW